MKTDTNTIQFRLVSMSSRYKCHSIQLLQTHSFAALLAVAVSSLLFIFLLLRLIPGFTLRHAGLPIVPAVPGLPIVGNLLQLKEKKPYQTFARMAQKLGPIYSIRTGSSSIIVLNSINLAKAMVTRFSSISTRKLSKALAILTSDKRMVATSDYNEFHQTVKKHILGNVLGAAAQKRHRLNGENLVENILSQLGEHVKTSSDLANTSNFVEVSSYCKYTERDKDFFAILKYKSCFFPAVEIMRFFGIGEEIENIVFQYYYFKD